MCITVYSLCISITISSTAISPCLLPAKGLQMEISRLANSHAFHLYSHHGGHYGVLSLSNKVLIFYFFNIHITEDLLFSCL